MEIKTPVSFSAYAELQDADGQTIFGLDQHHLPSEETQAAIIEAFNDSARYRLLVKAFSDDEEGIESREQQACEQAAKELDSLDPIERGNLTKLLDRALAILAETK